MISPKPQSLIDTMATQTRSNLSIPDPPVTSLPGRSTKTTSKPATKPASVPVLVETVSSEGTAASATASIDALDLVGDSGETVPASLEVAQVDITEVTNADTKNSVNNQNTKFSFASLFDSCPNTSSSAAPFDMKPAPNKDHDNDDDDDVDDDDDDDNDDDVTTSGKQASFNCSFLFQPSTSNPSLADELNGSYDLSFSSTKLYTHHGILTAGPTRSLRQILFTILESQASATG